MHQLRGLQVEQDPLSPAAAPSKRNYRLSFWFVIPVLGLLQVWAHRNEMCPDGISYIEIAWATARGGLHQVVNAYWSPLYPLLLSFVFRWFHPAVQWEFTAAHLLNCVVYVTSFAAFEFFLSELILQREWAEEAAERSLPVSPRSVRIWGYVFFLWASYYWLGPASVTPDLCVAAIVYLATALLFRIRRGRGNWAVFAGIGAMLGLGYLAKAAMFPLAFVFLFSAFCLSRLAGTSFRVAGFRTMMAAGVFSIFAVPLILALSAAKGRPSFGDSARIAYTEYIDGATKIAHWQGEQPGTGKPAHPTRKILSNPAMYEFAFPIQGSYPPWYDPSYWYEGVRPHFLLKGQLWAPFRAANVYLKIFSKSGALWVVFLALGIASRKAIAWWHFARGAWLVILPSVAAMGMYALVLVEFRYVAPFVLMLLIWTLARMRIAIGAEPQLVRRFQFVVVLAPALAAGWAATHDLYDAGRNGPYEPWVVAQKLHDVGIPAGTDVGYIGTGTDAYWAHLAGVRIVAEIPGVEQARFIAADTARRQQVLGLFVSVGARTVITRNADAANPADGWRQIPGTHHFIWQEPRLIAAPDKR
ncbi:MAG TPA: hypothetical protein VE263_18275 [Candidatus Angelobacter sp.]|nr:hypothetical protein [Candidatus Angelobacter sp.]